MRRFLDCGGLEDRIEVLQDLWQKALAVGCCPFPLWRGFSRRLVVAGPHYWSPGLCPAMTKERGGCGDGSDSVGRSGTVEWRPFHPLPASPACAGEGCRGGAGANQDGGAGRWPVPGVRLTSFRDGSGWAGGQCRGEWIDRWFADEEAESLADLVSFQM